MKVKDVAALPPEEKRAAVASLVSASLGPPNGQLGGVNSLIAKYEVKHGMTTEQMVAKFKSGELDDSADVSAWLILSKIHRG
jgi:hypothetical protein